MARRKACSDCGAVKPLTAFYSARGRPDGKRADCKACKNAEFYRWRDKNRAYWNAYARMRGKRPHVAAQRAAHRASAHAKAIALARERDPKTKAVRRAWRKRNREWMRQWYNNKNHKRREAYGAGLRYGDWPDIKAVHGNRCCYCGKHKPLTKDHWTPISRGGLHEIANIVPACMPCNARKHNRTGAEFFMMMQVRQRRVA